MLVRLTVENFALLERCDMEFAEGLNALTGQTGAGKSLLIDALGSILGERTSVDLIRHGCDTGLVEAFFSVADGSLAAALRAVLGAGIEGGELLLRRRLSRSGRSSVEANGRSIPLSVLKAAGELLVDIHGQNEHQRLLSASVQMEALDLFAGAPAHAARWREAYQALRAAVDEERCVAADRDNLERERELLEHRVKELEAAALSNENELDELAARRAMASHRQQITDTLGEMHRRLYEADDAITSAVERIVARLARLSGVVPDADRWSAMLEEARVALGEAGREAGEFLLGLDWSPGELERIDDRISQLRSVIRKYGPTLADAMRSLAAEKDRLGRLGSIDLRLRDARKASEAARRAALDAHAPLARARRAAAGKLARKVQAELAALGMEQADFRIDFTSLTDLAEPQDVDKASPLGLESCEFMLMPNPGEGWAPLRRIASGGEIARAMLALKSVLAGADNTPVLIFDEIDADIGGRLGEAVGAKLRSLAASHQVMVVTHLPQIAAFADRQFRVEKASDRGRTATTVRVVTGRDRIAELAEMIRGPEKAKEAYDQAEKMLKAGRRA